VQVARWIEDGSVARYAAARLMRRLRLNVLIMYKARCR
jgi:hypothetical protein